MTELKNSDPELLKDVFSIVSDLLSTYGWHIFIVVIITAIVWNNYLSKHFYQWKENRESLNTDPEVIALRSEQIEIARRRQQELYDQKVEQLRQKELERQNAKRQEVEQLRNNANDDHNDHNQLKRRSGKSLRRDDNYNPLMGAAMGSSYRPTRPSCGPGGGGA